MKQSEQMEALSNLVGQLIEEADPRAQERLLVDALIRGGWTQAAALWRRERSRDWIQVLAKGPDDLLPGRAQVEGIFDGDLPKELPLGKRVLFADRMHGGIGLALGGINDSLEMEDLLEGMFSVYVSLTGIGKPGVGAGEESLTDGLLDMLQGPTPGGGSETGNGPNLSTFDGESFGWDSPVDDSDPEW
jgi:hypothetical protein